MKKIVAFFLALSMAVVMLAGCGASQTPTTTEAPKAETKAATEAAPAAETEQKELTIAGIVFKDEFTMKMVQQGYEDAAKDYGVNPRQLHGRSGQRAAAGLQLHRHGR